MNNKAQADRAQIVMVHLEGRLTEPLKLAGVGKAVGMSTSTIQRCLRARGLDFRSALTGLRLAKAEALLSDEPDLKVDAVCRSVGWQSRKSLYNAVHRVRARTLADWRAEIRNMARGPVAVRRDAG